MHFEGFVVVKDTPRNNVTTIKV